MKIACSMLVVLAFLVSLAQGYSCALPENTEDKTVTCAEDGSTCTVKCKDQGFYMKSDKGAKREIEIIVKCSPDPSLQEPLPDCIPLKCPEIKEPEHGSYVCTLDNTYRSYCIFVCDEGYNTKGESNIQCQADDNNEGFGMWDSPPPTCLPEESCAELDNIDDKIVVCTDDYKVGSVCRVRCKEPGRYFETNGVAVNKQIYRMRCMKDQSWDKEAPECLPVTCKPEITTPLHGSYSCTFGNTFRSFCIFICDEGYEINGQSTTQCMADKNYDRFGKWDWKVKPGCVRESY